MPEDQKLTGDEMGGVDPMPVFVLVGMARGWPVMRAVADANLPEWTLAESFTDEGSTDA